MNPSLLINKLVHKFQNQTNNLFAIRRVSKLRNTKFTIISNNCWAGSVYRYFGLPYNSPTVGLYFFAEDYLKFVTNLKYYCSKKVEEVELSKSKYKEILIQKHQERVPIGRIDDIEIIFLHYHTFEEAREKWERRTSRIFWDDLFIKMSEMNNCEQSHVFEFDGLPYENKFIFTTKNYGLSSQVVMSDWNSSTQVRDDTTWFNKYIDVISFLNGKLIKKRQ